MNPQYTTENLLEIGFAEAAEWVIKESKLSYRFCNDNAKILFKTPDALYAFAVETEVRYIGKTSGTVQTRFSGYRSPRIDQRTNLKCHNNIRRCLEAESPVKILIFTNASPLRYDQFELSIPAGLEDSLIRAFQPKWNGTAKGGRAIPESYENEVVATGLEPPTKTPGQTKRLPEAPSFTIDLGATAYYDMGFINPGEKPSTHLAGHGEPVLIYLGCMEEEVGSLIDRNANSNGSVRIRSRAAIADWFQKNFQRGDLVRARILSKNEILLEAKAPVGPART